MTFVYKDTNLKIYYKYYVYLFFNKTYTMTEEVNSI